MALKKSTNSGSSAQNQGSINGCFPLTRKEGYMTLRVGNLDGKEIPEISLPENIVVEQCSTTPTGEIIPLWGIDVGYQMSHIFQRIYGSSGQEIRERKNSRLCLLRFFWEVQQYLLKNPGGGTLQSQFVGLVRISLKENSPKGEFSSKDFLEGWY